MEEQETDIFAVAKKLECIHTQLTWAITILDGAVGCINVWLNELAKEIANAGSIHSD